MNTRGAGAASRRTRPAGVRPVYEDLKPMCEWKYEEGADIVLYHLPGFTKEQIRIIAESKGVLKVHGQRLVAGNKWSRFQEEIAIPQDCNMSEIRAKFEAGVLRIRMPKRKTLTNKRHAIDENTHESSTSGATGVNTQEKPRQFNEKISGEELQRTSNNIPSLTPFKAGNQPRPDKAPVTSPSKLVEDVSGGAKTRDASGYGHVHDKSNDVEDVISGRENQNKPLSNTDRDNNNSRFKQDYKLSNDHKVIKNYTSKRMDEDRQLLVNMGVAILVLMTLGATISYSFGLND